MATDRPSDLKVGTKPTLLIVTAGYFPGVKHGGIATSRQNLAFAMRDYFDVRIVTLNHDFRESAPYVGVTEGWNNRPEGRALYLTDSECNRERFESIIAELCPVVIYASSTITSYFTFNRPVFLAAHAQGVPVVVTPDGDLCDEALAIKPLKKKIALALCCVLGAFNKVYFQITLPEEGVNLTKYLGVSSDRVQLLPNLPFMLENRMGYRKEKGVLKAVFCSRFSAQKNPNLAIEMLLDAAIAAPSLHFSFDIYGTMEDEALWEKCERLIKAAPHNLRVEYHGALSPGKAKTVFMDYDLMVLPTKSENYCYAVEESLLCGCPVLLSRGTTPWDDLDGVAGYVEPLSEPHRFVERLLTIARMDEGVYAAFTASVRSYVEDKLHYDALRKSYIKMFEGLKQGGR